jgi:UDP-4-amino-4-deoxy-L-arabinose formyltransferase/UDP-glucuronic acid dehydrogenase (UDP-4-keto-hexauronic acid decarboxylating)
MRFALLGRTRMAYETVRACTEAGHEPVLIGSSPAAPEYSVGEADFEALAEELGAPFFSDSRLNRPEMIELLGSARAQVAVSVNWPTVIGAEVRGQFDEGVINAHAGDLPRYRGNAVPNWAILEREPRIAVVLHRMIDELDAGPILARRELALRDDTYIGEVYEFLESNVPEMFAETLTALERGEVEEREQTSDPAASLRCHPRRPLDARIDWGRDAEHIGRLVRASAEPFAGAYTWLEGRRVIVWRARPAALPGPTLGIPGQVIEIRPDSGEVAVLTGEGQLIMEEVEHASERGAPAKLVPSTRARFGLDLGEEVESLRRRLSELERRLDGESDHG